MILLIDIWLYNVDVLSHLSTIILTIIVTIIQPIIQTIIVTIIQPIIQTIIVELIDGNPPPHGTQTTGLILLQMPYKR